MDSDSDSGEDNALSGLLEDVKNNEMYVKAANLRDSINQHIDKAIEYSWKRAEVAFNRIYATVIEMPKVTVVLMLIMAAWFGWVGKDFQGLIEDDVEIFLPDGADSTDYCLKLEKNGLLT